MDIIVNLTKRQFILN